MAILDGVIVRKWSRATVAGSMSLVMLLGVGTCASHVPKEPPAPSADQVRGHADRAFEKLKQEEQERAAQPPIPR